MSSLDFWLARKLLLSRKNIGYISWSGLISVLGVAVGCCALLLSVAVLNGFEREIQQRIIGFEADLRITGGAFDRTRKEMVEDVLNHDEGIEAFSFFVEKKGIIISDEGWSLAYIKAVEDSRMSRIYSVEGTDTAKFRGGLAVAHIGKGVAERISVAPGDTVRLMNPVDSQLFLGIPASVNVVVGSVFETGIIDFDDKYCFIPLTVGQHLFKKWDTFHGADLRLAKGTTPDLMKGALKSRLPENLTVSTWKDLHGTLFSAMRMEKVGSTIVLSLIVVVASFNIASTLIMLVMEKVKEIGILRAMGLSRKRIERIVDLQGAMVGGLGMILGLATGLSLIFAQKQWGLIKLPQSIYFVNSLPVLLPWMDIATILTVGSALIVVSLYYPARLAGRLMPTTAIQFQK